MTIHDVGIFSCKDCIGGRERGHEPTNAPDCRGLQYDGLCGKAMLAQLIKDGNVTINIMVST